MLNNVKFHSPSGTYGYSLNVGGHVLSQGGFKTEPEAGWACDVARYILRDHLRRSRPYNYPARIEKLNDADLSLVSPDVSALKSRLDSLKTPAPAGSVTADPGEAARLLARIEALRTDMNRALEFTRQTTAALTTLATIINEYPKFVSMARTYNVARQQLIRECDEATSIYLLGTTSLTELETLYHLLVKPVDLSKELGEVPPVDTVTEPVTEPVVEQPVNPVNPVSEPVLVGPDGTAQAL